MTKPKIEAGNILIAEPFMLESEFKQSVVLICDHMDSDGTVGFVLNKRINMDIQELIADFPEFESEVFFGGPVQTDTIHYIHNVGDLLDESRKVCNGVYWGGDFEKLKFLIKSELIQPENIRFFVGYAGWSPGQLYEEMGVKSWILSRMHHNYIFKENPDFLWEKTLIDKGNHFSILSQVPDNINWS